MPTQKEINALLRTVRRWPYQAQFEVFNVLARDLGVRLGEVSKEQERRLARAEALEMLLAVAEHLGLPAGEAPTMAQFDQAASELGLDWSSARVLRVWERWSLALEVFKGQRSATAFLGRDFHAAPDRRHDNREEPLRGVKLWLRSKPQSESAKAYNEFAKAYNTSKKASEKRLRSAQSAAQALRRSGCAGLT